MKGVPCPGRDKCKNDGESCVIEDDMLDLYGEVVAADVIIFSTPIYWWNMSAQLKTFLDRLSRSTTKRPSKERSLFFS
ncbi:flavodoxin family protein [Mesotoga sp. B105.6.4]|uniref:flavodoxin family protein n=1 Tax=Mesotoga sp. B105.6.4 TaxID=1582224 RepID=UPI0015E0F9AA